MVQMNRIFVKNIQVRADILPVFFASCRLQDVTELTLGAETVHNVDIVLDTEEYEGLVDLILVLQHDVFVLPLLIRTAVQIHVHTEGAHITLELIEACIHHAVSILLCLVHVIQLGENDIERIF